MSQNHTLRYCMISANFLLIFVQIETNNRYLMDIKEYISFLTQVGIEIAIE